MSFHFSSVKFVVGFFFCLFVSLSLSLFFYGKLLRSYGQFVLVNYIYMVWSRRVFSQHLKAFHNFLLLEYLGFCVFSSKVKIKNKGCWFGKGSLQFETGLRGNCPFSTLKSAISNPKIRQNSLRHKACILYAQILPTILKPKTLTLKSWKVVLCKFQLWKDTHETCTINSTSNYFWCQRNCPYPPLVNPNTTGGQIDQPSRLFKKRDG